MVDQVTGNSVNGDRPVVRVSPPAATRPAVQPGGEPAPRVRETAPDLATLSGVATELASKPPIDADRVAQIKHAVANGTFPILPATIADRLLALRYEWMSNEQA